MINRTRHQRLISTALTLVMVAEMFGGVFSIPVAQAAAGIFRPISYQGKVTSTGGVAIANGSYNMRFKMFSAASGGVATWTETWDNSSQRVTMTGGLFSVLLGTHVTMTGSVNFNTDSLYLQVEFDPGNDGVYEETFNPRRRFASVPYAHNANTLDGLDASQFVRKDQAEVMSGTLTIKPNDPTKVGADIVSTAGAAATAALKLSTQGANHIVFGTGAANYDTNLYRSAVGTLKTDGVMIVAGNMSGKSLSIMSGNPSYILGDVGIGKSGTPKAKLDVLGTISGSSLTINGSITNTGSLTTRGTVTFRSLTGCAALVTNSSGVVSCGTPTGTFGSGNVITIGDGRYVNTSGDTMTGALNVRAMLSGSRLSVSGNANVTGALMVRGNISTRGEILMGDSNTSVDRILFTMIDSAGSLRYDGDFSFDDRVAVGKSSGPAGGLIFEAVGIMSGALMRQNGGGVNYFMGDMAIGKTTLRSGQKFEVLGTISGSALKISNLISGSGGLTVRGAIAFRSLTGCSTLQTDSNGLLSCGSASSSFGSGNVITIGNQRYVSKQGDTMTGALTIQNGNTHSATATPLLNIRGTMSGRSLYISGTGSSPLFIANATTGRVGVGTSTPKATLDVVGTISGSALRIYANSAQAMFVNNGSGILNITSLPAVGELAKGQVFFATEQGLSLVLSASNTPSEKMVMGYYDGSQYRSALEYSNTTGFTNLLLMQSGGKVGIGTNAPKTTLDVVGTISGSALHISNLISGSGGLTARGAITFRSLTSCTSLQTSSTGLLSCGSAGSSFGSGNVITIGDGRYVNTSGDTMTGVLTIQNGNTHSATSTPLLNVRGTMSGRSLYISGTGGTALVMTNITTGRVGIGTSTPKATLDVVGSISGTTLRVSSPGSAAAPSLAIGRLATSGFYDSGMGGIDVAVSGTQFGTFWMTGGRRIFNAGGGTLEFQNSGNLGIAIDSSGNAAVGAISGAVGQRMTVYGSISGTQLKISNLISGSGGLTVRGAIAFRTLTGCSALQTDSNGVISCGSNAGTFGSGNVITIGDGRYVNTSGDTMTGALTIQNGNTHSATATPLLNVRGTMSGRSLYITGTGGSALVMTNITTGRVGIGTSAPKAKLDVVGTISGALVTQNGAGSNYFMGNLGLGTTGPLAKLDVVSSGTNFALFRSATQELSLSYNRTGLNELGLIEGGGDTIIAAMDMVQGSSFFYAGGLLNASGSQVGIGTYRPKAKLDVLGTISGSALTINGSITNTGSLTTRGTITFRSLTGCAALVTNSSGVVSCGNPAGTFGSGNVITIGDGRYVNTSGDTMTGALTIQNGNTHSATTTPLLNIRGTMSGRSLYVSGSGASPILMTSIARNRVGIGTSSPKATLDVVGTISGSALTVSSFPATRIPFMGAGGAMTTSANLIWNGNQLDMNSSSNTGFRTYLNGGDGWYFYVGAGGGGNFAMYDIDAGKDRMTLLEDSSVRMGNDYNNPDFHIDTSRNIAIGKSTNTIKAKLDVLGTISGSQLVINGSITNTGSLTTRGTITFRSLTGCAALVTNSSGVVSCGTPSGTFGSGNVITIGNQRYVSKQGDTMTGALVIAVTGGNQNTLGLRVINTMSGAIVQATKQLRSSGTLITESGAVFDGGTLFVDAAGDRIGMGTLQPLYDVHVEKDSTGTGVRNVTRDTAVTGSAFLEVRNSDNAAATLGVYGPNYVSSPYFTSNGALSATNGLFIYSDSGVSSGGANSISFMTGGNDPLTQIRMVIDSSGRVSIGKSSVTSGQKFEVLGTISGSALKISNLISGSGGMTVRGAIAFRSLTSCTTLQTDSNGVLSCGSGGGSFGSGNVITIGNQRYVSKQGDTMTGALVIQNGNTHSATAAALLNVRGTMSGRSLYISGTGSSALFMTNITTGRVGIGTSAPKTTLDVIGTISGSALRLNGNALVNMTSTSASGVVINGLAGQASPFLSFRNAAGFPKLQVDAGGYLRSQTGVTVISRASAGSFGGDFTFTIKRDGTNNQGNGAMLKFTDGAVSAYIKWISNSSSQNVMDLEFHNANGLNMSMPNAGGVYFYNPVQNSQDISIVKVPTQTLYPGGGTWANQATFKLDPMVFAGTSPLTVTRAAQLYIRSAPIRGGNMTFDKSTAAQFDTGGSNYRGLIIRGGNSQSGSLMEFTNTGHTILSAFTASGYLALGGQNVKKTLVLEAYGTMSGRSLHISNLMSGSGGLTARGSITFRSLTSCSSLQSDSTGLLSCGSASSSFGSGNVITIGDGRYVNTSGDTMTGALTIQNGNTHSATTTPLLNVRGTMSGRSLYISGTGSSPLLFTNILNGRVGIGTSSPQGTLDVRATDAATVGMYIKGATSQSSNFMEVRDSTSALVFAVDPSVTDMFSGTGPGLDFGSNAVKINTTAGVIDFTYASGQGMRVIKASVFGTDDAFFQAKPGASGYAVFEGYNGAGTIISSEADPILFAPSRIEAARFSAAGLFGLDTNNPGARLSVSGSTVMGGNGNTIGGRAAKATLDVLGIISGSQLIINGSITNTGSLTTRGTVTFRSLTSCTALQTDSNGVLSCGSGGTGSFGSGNVITIGDGRYVNTSGDTMTGALRINVTGGDFNTLGLRVVNTMSGAHLHAEKLLTSSGALRVEGTGNSYIMGSVGIGTVSPQQPLHVVGETDGSAIGPLLVTYAGGSAIGVALTLDATAAAGGKKFSFISTGNTAGPSGGKFAVYNGSDNRYVFLADDNGQYIAGVNQYTSLGQITSYPNSATTKGLVVRGAASQTAFLQEWQNSAGVGLAVITATGALGLGTSSPNARLAVSGATVISDRGNVVASRVAKATLDVIGSISGSSLFVANLNAASCDVKSTNGVLSCGTDATGGAGGFGSGNVITIGDGRYVNTSGDTMTGALVIQNGNTHSATATALLNVRGTMSGKQLWISGSGTSPLIYTGNGRVGIGTSSPKAPLDVIGTMSGTTVIGSYRGAFGTNNTALGTVAGVSTNSIPSFYGAAQVGGGSSTPIFDINNFGSRRFALDAYGQVYLGDNTGTNFPTFGTSAAGLNFANNLGDKQYLYNGSNTSRWGFGIQNWTFAMFMDGSNPGTGKFSWRNSPNSSAAASTGDDVQNLYTTGTLENIINTTTAKGHIIRISSAKQTANAFEIQSGATVLTSMSQTGWLAIGKTGKAITALDVVGTVSGSILYASRTIRSSGSIVLEGMLSGATILGFGLSADCDGSSNKITWDSTTSRFKCETDQTGAGGSFGSGNVITIGDGRYVNTSGDTMTGALIIQNGNTHAATSPPLLTVRGTMSGKQLWISGSGTAPLIFTGTGRIGFGTKTPKAFMDVNGTIENGLVGYWPMDELGGSQIVDYSTSNNSGAFVGSMTRTVGRFGRALSFNGSSYVTMGAQSELAGLQVPLTLAGWFKQTNTTGNQVVYAAYTGTTTHRLWSMIRMESGVMVYYTSLANGTYQAVGTLSAPAGQWHFFSVTVSGTTSNPTATLTLNNLTQTFSLAAMSTTPDLTVPVVFGSTSLGGEYLSGLLDNFTIHNRALSRREIADLYRNNPLGNGGTMISALRIESGATLDVAGMMSGHRLTVSGNANITGALLVRGNITTRAMLSGARLTVSGNANITGALLVAGGITTRAMLSGARLTISGNANITGALLVRGNITTRGTFSGAGLVINGTSTFFGNVVPGADNRYDLGTNSVRWRHLYLSGGTLNIGTATNSGAISYRTSGAEGLMFYGKASAFASPSMFISSGGLVAIGKTSVPKAMFEVMGSMSGKSLYISGSGGFAGLVSDVRSGKIGIGTADPKDLLHMIGANRDSQIYFQTRTVGSGGGGGSSSGPNNPGTLASDNSFGTVAWGSTSNAASQNDTYSSLELSTGQDSQYLKATNFGFSIPSNATIAGITVEVDKKADATTVSDTRARIVKGGAIGTTDKSVVGAWTTVDNDTYSSYGGSSDLWSDTWTYTDINDSTFGFALAAHFACDDICLGGAPNTFVDHIRITVAYTTGGATPIYGDWIMGSDYDDSGNFKLIQSGATMRTVMEVASGGLVGIGTGTSLTAKMTIYTDNGLNQPGLIIQSAETTSTQDMFRIRTNYSTTNNAVYRITASGATYADAPYNSAGADYAEYFPSNPQTQILAGEAVCLDTTKPNMVKRCEREADPNIIGIRSTKPSVVGNAVAGKVLDGLGLPVPGYTLVGLIGQLEARAIVASSASGSTVTGALVIKPGDSLTSASKRGYLRKAMPGESTVGVALTGLASGEGEVRVLIARTNTSNLTDKIDAEVTAHIGALKVDDKIKASLEETLSASSFDARISSAVTTQLSALQPMQDRVSTLEETILSLDNQLDALSSQLSGALLNGVGTSNPTGSNLTLTGSLAANALSAEETLAVGRDARIGGDLYLEGALIMTGDMNLSGNVTTGKLTAASGSQIAGTFTVAGDLLVAKNLTFQTGAVLTARQLLLSGALIVRGPITIEGLATFLGDVQVKGELIVSSRQAGFAIIDVGQKEITVRFEPPFKATPVVTATSDAFTLWRVKASSMTGFTLEIQSIATEKMKFSWQALTVETPMTVSGTFLAVPEGQTLFPLDAQGVPLSTSAIWNACIRHQQPLDPVTGQPFSCSRYTPDLYIWNHPDFPGMTFVWNDSYDPPLLILPDGYVGQKMTMSSSSSSTDTGTGSSISSSSESSASSDSSASSESSSSDSSSSDSSDSSSSDSSESSESSDSSSSDSSSSDSSSSDASSSDSSSSESSSSEGSSSSQ